MAEQQRGRRAIEVGPTGRTVAANIARLRERRGLTTRQLSGLLERAGRPIPASGITRMEKGERVVTSDEIAALAVAFGVSPSALLLPLTDRHDDRVEITGGGEVDALRAWEWGIGRVPLKTTPEKERTELAEHRLFGRPQWLQDHVRYSVLASAKGGQPTAEGRALMEDLKERYRQETGEELDPDAVLNHLFRSAIVEPEEGSDG
ncbi:helix-turn-helix domain-containing protein [Streptomyces coeruleorubidus]|uniref:helix-turn-helix domain-containing protein n=1 Tax=Streptomyces coeruleorubidus TaxID=116188 RepID=UPI003665E1F1